MKHLLLGLELEVPDHNPLEHGYEYNADLKISNRMLKNSQWCCLKMNKKKNETCESIGKISE
jgi:hypothetical protein